MFGDVIVPLDGSDLSARALVPGAALAKTLDSTLRVVSYTTAWNHDAIVSAVTRQCEAIDSPGLSVTVEPAGPGIIERLSDLRRGARTQDEVAPFLGIQVTSEEAMQDKDRQERVERAKAGTSRLTYEDVADVFESTPAPAEKSPN